MKTIEEIDARLKEIRSLLDNDDADIDALEKEINELTEQRKTLVENAERRKALITSISNGAGTVIETHNTIERTVDEKRADNLIKNGKLETRALLSTGTIAKPTKVDGISDLAEVGIGIIDDVHAVPLTGNGAYTVAYKKTEATAADVTDGNVIGGTGSTYGTVTINPAEWGTLDTVSNQVKKMSPLSYLSEVERSALLALRIEACAKITAAVLVLGFRSVRGKGGVKLYINQEDLMTLGKIRGTNEKKALYEIKYDAGTNVSGVISEGGVAVPFRIVDELTTGTQLFGQPGSIDMPMWDKYQIATDEGGEYFSKNLIAVRGIQTANADLVAYHGMQIIKQGAE